MSTKPIIECVANFSHGKPDFILDNIIQSINNISGQKLLHIDSNLAANRTVLTFAVIPEAVVEAAFQAIKKAGTLIDMRNQEGVHPRIGATDVCPLVPIRNIKMDKVVHYAKKLAERVGNELAIPVYLYEHSALANYRKFLPQIRKGGYEGLTDKMKLPEWIPDYGPHWSLETEESIKKSGAIVIGARTILVAFNISLNTKNIDIAQRIAEKVRTIGYFSKKDNKRIPGTFKKLRAIGWYIEEFKHVQVSMNLLDYKISSPLQVFEQVKEIAAKEGIEVIGSELIGLIPEECILEAGNFALGVNSEDLYKKEDIIQAGVKHLKLNSVKEFNAEDHILEYALRKFSL